MKRRGFSRKRKIHIIVLTCVVWGAMLFGVYASAAVTEHAVSEFAVEGLEAIAVYEDDGTTTVTATTNSSITVTTKAMEETTGVGCDTKYQYAKRSSTLKIKNTGEDALKITYTLTSTPGSNGGAVSTSASENPNAGTNLEVNIKGGGSLDITAVSGANNSSSNDQVIGAYGSTYTITITSATKATINTEVTFKAVSPLGRTVPGSYTVKMGGEELTVPGTYTNDINTQYTLSAQPNGDYSFKGWYVNGVKKSTELTFTTPFLDAVNTVEAQFTADILIDAMSLSSTDSSGAAIDPTLTKYDFVEATSAYTPAGYINTQPSKYGSPNATAGYATLYTGPHGTTDNEWILHFYEDPVWTDINNSTLQSTSSGKTETEYAQSISNVNGYAIVNSPVMRIKALEDIKLTFDYNVSMTKGNASVCYMYYYIGKTSNATRAEIVKTGTPIVNAVASSSGTGYEISVSKGSYVYLYSYGYYYNKSLCAKGTKSYDYTYTSTIGNFTVTPVNEHYSIQAGFQDNTGITLGAGKLRVKDATANTDYTIGTTGVTTRNYENVAGTNVTLSVVTPPSGYTHIGWRDETAGTTAYTTTYSFTLNGNRTVYALFVPAMTITMGSNGYSDATYEYKPLNSSSMTTQNEQYVARNADGSAFYTTLAEAFDATDTVVLLAGDTFNGDFAVPEGKTLVVPYGLDDDGSTTPDQITTGYAGLSNYVTVTVNGNMTVDGTMVVSGRQYGSRNGSPGGPIGRLVVAAGANIMVNGTLDAFGAVGGDGHIEANSGANVYELMEIKDMRGIKQLYSVYQDGKSKEVFLFSSYFLKNIEAEVTYNVGARLYGHYSTVIQGEHSHGDAPIIGTSNDEYRMFGILTGSLTKRYDRINDKTIFRIDEKSDVDTGNFKVSVGINIIGPMTITVDTGSYFLPMPYGYEIEVVGNLNISKKFKMLPGAIVDVKEPGTLTVSGSLVFYRLNDYDTLGPGTDKAQGFSSAGYPVTPTRLPTGAKYPTINKTTIGSAKLNVDGTMIVSGGVYVTNGTSESSLFSTYDNGYNNLTGTGIITINNVGSKKSIYEAQQQSEVDDVSFIEVPISSLKALPYEATADTPESYTLTFAKTTYYGYINSKGLSTWSTQKPVTLTYDANGGTGSIEPTRVPSGAKATVAANNGNILFGDYKFTGWKDKDGNTYAEGQIIETLTEDLTLYAQWERTFTVTWVDWNGTELERDEKVAEGSTPSYDGETPTRAETEDIIYTFTGWSPEPSPVTKDITYKAVYSELHKNVKLIHADDTVDYYETVFTAVNASRAGETVMLLKDRTEPMIRIAQDKDLILDLNGKKITSESGSAIENNGTISITGSGTVSAASSGSAILNNGTIRSISGGTFIGAKVAGSGLLIAQGSKVGTISGGTFQGQYGINVAGTLDTINNATLTDTSTGLYVNGGTVNTISGGTFTGGSIGLSVSNTGTVKTISGGTFVSTGAGGFAVKSSSGTAIEFVASGSPDSGNYNGPLFRSESGSRSGTVSDYGNTTMFKYPDGQTVSCKANEKGYFYIGKKEIYTVRVQWDGGLSYIYQPNQYTWIPEQMRYERTETAGWISEDKGTTPMVTVSNGGNAANETYGNITVGISYNCNEGYNAIGMDFFVDDVKKGSSNSAKLVESMEPGKSVKTTMKLVGEPPTSIQKGTIVGRVTLTLTPAKN